MPVEDLSLSKLFPSAERAGVAVAFDYMQWLGARGISPSTEGAPSGGQGSLGLHTLIALSSTLKEHSQCPSLQMSQASCCMPKEHCPYLSLRDCHRACFCMPWRLCNLPTALLNGLHAELHSPAQRAAMAANDWMNLSQASLCAR